MKIFVTGGRGMVGRHLIPALNKLSRVEVLAPTSAELNLLDKKAVDAFYANERPDCVIHLAAIVGGIQANMNEPVKFLVENSLMNMHVIHGAMEHGVKKLINIGSSCMYPKDKPILHEDDLLSDRIEPTNEGYGLSKICAARLCAYISKQHKLDYKTIVPTNLFGEYDNFDPIGSHLLPAIVRKLHRAKLEDEPVVEIWGDGEARREFMHASDLVSFILMALPKLNTLPEHINVGLGFDYSINDYYQIAAEVIGYTGAFKHDLSKPVGMRKKLLDVTKAHAMGWKAALSLEEGIEKTYQFYVSTFEKEVAA